MTSLNAEFEWIAFNALMRTKEAYRAEAQRLAAELADANRELEILRRAIRTDEPELREFKNSAGRVRVLKMGPRVS